MLPLEEGTVRRPVVAPVICDARQEARYMPQVPWDLVLTDPPYRSLERHRAAGGSTVRLREWFPTMTNAEILRVLHYVGLGMRPGAFALVMADWVTATAMAQADGLELEELEGTEPPSGQVSALQWRTPWVWVKTNRGGRVSGGMGYYGRGAYELVLVLQRPGPVHPDAAEALRAAPNVVMAPRVRGGYPTEKPEELATKLIAAFAPAARRVLDPFAGSGWAGVGALGAGADAVLWEINPEAPVHTREWPAWATAIPF